MAKKGTDVLGTAHLFTYLYVSFLYVSTRHSFTSGAVVTAIKPEKCLGKVCLTLKLRANS